MTQPPKKKSDSESNWAEDQKDRSYYYDDAHGYETYDPEDDADEVIEDEERTTLSVPSKDDGTATPRSGT